MMTFNWHEFDKTREAALEIFNQQEDSYDDLDDFLREIYADTGYDDQDLEGMLEEWEADDAEDNN